MLILGPMLFKTFINDPAGLAGCTLGKFLSDTELGGEADVPHGHAGILRETQAGQTGQQEPHEAQQLTY